MEETAENVTKTEPDNDTTKEEIESSQDCKIQPCLMEETAKNVTETEPDDDTTEEEKAEETTEQKSDTNPKLFPIFQEQKQKTRAPVSEIEEEKASSVSDTLAHIVTNKEASNSIYYQEASDPLSVKETHSETSPSHSTYTNPIFQENWTHQYQHRHHLRPQ